MIPNGIDPDDLVAVDDLAALRARFAAPDERLVLLIGRLVYEKGFQVALDALPGVIERLGDVRFLVAGSGTHEAELKKQARKLGLTEHGTFLGWIGDDVLHSLYLIADLCVVPSLYEPFGIVALEAMASGVPCIVADTGGLREIVPNFEVGLRFRGGSAAAPRHDDRDGAHRPRPARPPGHGGVRARAALRLGRRGAPDAGGLHPARWDTLRRMTDSGVLRLRQDSIAWRQLDEDLVVLDLRSSTYLAANPAATLLWQALERGSTRDALVAELTAEFAIDAETAGADVDAFIADCRARELLAP